jgi:hypothetical protein
MGRKRVDPRTRFANPTTNHGMNTVKIFYFSFFFLKKEFHLFHDTISHSNSCGYFALISSSNSQEASIGVR